ncbi:hypothetical protein T11_6917 [Trichinella zimbabwensis]|uniref:Uncharacterized protein n=1 Tax=Trichinella zimbabwensis TaxID=268475 RepID=A0A0V1GEW3_9BILA|nr:hypothetical protein T11_6917 [Trichinella zimbabwensis]
MQNKSSMHPKCIVEFIAQQRNLHALPRPVLATQIKRTHAQ